MEVKVITDLAAEPVTLAEIKQFLQMDADFTADDTMLTALNTSAREYLEKLTGLSFGEKTLKLTKQATGRGLIEVLYGPVGEITSVVDEDGEAIDHDVYGTEFPTIDTGSLFGQVEVNYTAGFTVLPESLKTAIKLKVQAGYDNRPELDQMAENLVLPHSRSFGLPL